MKIGINASFLRKQNTGIGQVTANFVKKVAECQTLKDRKQKFEYFLYLEEKLPKNIKLPENFHERVLLPPYKRDDIIRSIWWQKFILPRKATEDGCNVFLSLYQCATVMPKNIRHIMVVHDILLEFFPQYINNLRKKYFWYLSKQAIKKADKIISVSHRTEKDLIQHLGINPKKISVSYVDVDEIYKRNVSQLESQHILNKYNLEPGYIYNGGGMEIRKNTENVLKAYKLLWDKYGQNGWLPKLVISGKLMPELAPLVTDAKKLVKELNLEDRVILLDYVSQEDLPAIYNNAVLFVYPSLYEGFGLPILEAMNQGIPVITSKVSSLPEIGSDSVLYCDPKKAEDIAMVIKNVLNNNHLKAALSMKGKERANHFSFESFLEKFFNIIKNLK